MLSESLVRTLGMGGAFLFVFLSDNQHPLIGEIHPGEIVDQAIHFSLLVPVNAGHVFPAEFGASEHIFVNGFFDRTAHQRHQDFAISVEVSINFADFVYGGLSFLKMMLVFAQDTAKTFVSTAKELFATLEAVFFHVLKVFKSD